MTTLSFEQLNPGDGMMIPDGYKGMSWDENFWTQDGTTSGGGYVNGAHSGTNVAYNGGGNPATFSTLSADFRLKSGYFTGAWNNDLTVTVTAYDDGVLVAIKEFVVDFDAPTFMKFGHRFASVDSVVVDSSGGTDANPSDTGSGEHLVMDDLVVKFEDPGFNVIQGAELEVLHHQAPEWMLAG